MEEEYFLVCPYCWQTISMIFDGSTASQTYVEDCEVCCRPLQVTYHSEDGRILSAEAKKLDD